MVVPGSVGSTVLLPAGGDVSVDGALGELAQTVLRAIPGVGGKLFGIAAVGRFDGCQHRPHLLLVAAVLAEILGDDDLAGRIHRRLSVVALNEAVLGLHDPALGIGEVALRLVSWLGWRRRRLAGGPAGIAAVHR